MYPEERGQGRESPDLGHLLPLWCKYSHHGHLQATDRTRHHRAQSWEERNPTGSHKLAPASSSNTTVSSYTLDALFLTSLSAPLPSQIPKGLQSRNIWVCCFHFLALRISNFKGTYSFHYLINSLHCLSRKFPIHTQTLRSTLKCHK